MSWITGSKIRFTSAVSTALRFQLDCIPIVSQKIEPRVLVLFVFRVVPFDVCKVKWLPHPERLLSALGPMPQVATRNQGCPAQRVKACRNLLTSVSLNSLELDWRSV